MIFKQTRRKTFTMVDNEAVRDKRLSFKATGLLVFLLSLPDEWEPNSNHLASIKTDGRDSVRAGLRELEDMGYLIRERKVLPNGTFDWVIEVYEKPQTMDGKSGHGERKTGSPVTGNPTTGKPSTENPSSKESLRLLTDELLSSDDEIERFSTPAPISDIRKSTGLNRRKKQAS